MSKNEKGQTAHDVYQEQKIEFLALIVKLCDKVDKLESDAKQGRWFIDLNSINAELRGLAE